MPPCHGIDIRLDEYEECFESLLTSQLFNIPNQIVVFRAMLYLTVGATYHISLSLYTGLTSGHSILNRSKNYNPIATP